MKDWEDVREDKQAWKVTTAKCW